MCVEKCKINNEDRMKLGTVLKSALAAARRDQRLVCGLIPAISYLEQQDPDEVVFCVLPSCSNDSTTHIQSVLLQAFCYENYIPVIQVDSSEKLALLCGMAKDQDNNCNCALITSDHTLLVADNTLPMTKHEKYLTDFYECAMPQPIIQLPVT